MSQDTKEHERKWLVQELPESLIRNRHVQEIRQGYLAATADGSVRVRAATLDGLTFHHLTIKTGRGVTRNEHETLIPSDLFHQLWEKTYVRLEKRRYWWMDNGCSFALDIYGGRLEGLITIEVESPVRDFVLKFKPLDWFGEEVTDRGEYTNAMLAANGLPK